MATIRLESLGANRVSEELVRTSTMTPDEFEVALLASAQPDAQGIRTRLNEELVPQDDRDEGKTVLFKDLAFYGVSPSAFGRDEGLVVASDLPRAAANLKWIQETAAPSAKYVGLFGYPTTEAEYSAVFGEEASTGAVDAWKMHNDEARDIARRYGVKTIEVSEASATKAKARILREFEQADGILFVIAHADGCTISLPGGAKISITPEDIGRLNLSRRPFVVLRICQSSDHGFASAFIRAGARGIWMNRGVIEASVANDQISRFMDALRRGKRIGEAIDEVLADDTAARAGTHIVIEP